MKILKALTVLILWLFVCFGAAYVGAFFTSLSVDSWYPTLIKPSWTPSGAFIGAVWSLLYTLMALAAWLIWLKAEGYSRHRALAIFAFQLVLNVAWSGLFFGLRSPGLASLEIIALLAAILATTWVFWRISTVAGSMMIPYLVWVAFAAVLNWAIWFLNASNH